VVTPTTQIYSQIQDALYLDEVLLAGTLAILVVVFILVRWNHILQGEVKWRTTELHESETKARELENSYDATQLLPPIPFLQPQQLSHSHMEFDYLWAKLI
jgi:hypothetical protein